MKLLILDRDGVINRDTPDYIKAPEEWIPLPGSLEAIALANSRGWRVAVATNQSAVGRGLIDEFALARIHGYMIDCIEDAGGHIEMIAFCPHGPDDDCDCRKPKPGLLHAISSELGVPLDNIPVIGDSLRDIEAARAVGARPVLVETGNGKAARDKLADGDVETFADLAAAVAELTRE